MDLDPNTVRFFVTSDLRLRAYDGGAFSDPTMAQVLCLPDIAAKALRVHADECGINVESVIAEVADGFITMEDVS